ncbi:MAG: ferrochelatase [Pseudomonadota bacterium]
MARYTGTPSFSHEETPKIGVLLINLGTPSEPTPRAVKTYLAEFLADPRVVELSRWLWMPILHGIILNLRPKRSAAAYQKVWTDEGSPLLLHTQRLTHEVQAAFVENNQSNIVVECAMRYGEPSVPSVLGQMIEQGCRRLLVLPLYPQYAAATTASAFDAVSKQLQKLRWVPDVRFVHHYHDWPQYISALSARIRDHWQTHGRSNRLLMSFHGIPNDYFLAGDPYHCQCQSTARLLAEDLGLSADDYGVAFQSRFGPRQWLKPYTDETLKQWAQQGIKTVDVVCPGFAADCLETLEEIAIQYAQIFAAEGGTLNYIPALNDNPNHRELLTSLINANMQGWSTNDLEASLQARLKRAKELGAKS